MSGFQKVKQVASTISKVATFPILVCLALSLLFDRPQSVFQSSLQRVKNQFESTDTTPNYKMAWRSSGSSNAALVANLASNGLIKDDRVRQAMLKVGFVQGIRAKLTY